MACNLKLCQHRAVPAFLVLGLAVVIASPLAAQPTPLGDEFVVNTYTTNQQFRPAVAKRPDGSFLAVWQEGSTAQASQDGDAAGIRGQFFDPMGVRVGTEFQINTNTTGAQQFPRVDGDSAGNFVVVWNDYYLETVQAQRFMPNGNPLGAEFEVNSVLDGDPTIPDVAVASGGDFVVVWHGGAPTGSDYNYSIQARRFDSAGMPLAAAFQVNTYTTGTQRLPSVAIADSGAFIVSWTSRGSPGNDDELNSVQMRRFDMAGIAIGNDFQVNTYTTDNQARSRVSAEGAGDFIVVWISNGSYGTDTSNRSIQAQRFNSTGAVVGGQFQVNTVTTDSQYYPNIAIDAAGDFAVVWHSATSSGDDTSICSVEGQFFGSDGSFLGAQFQVNTYTTYYQNQPAIAASGSGEFVVLWDDFPFSAQSDGDQFGVFGQLYGTNDALIFADGFKSGDTTFWSATSP